MTGSLKNIQNALDLKESGIEPGDRVYLGVCGPGQISDVAIYLGEYVGSDYRALCGGTTGVVTLGIKVKIGNEFIDLPWGDIVELWPINKINSPEKLRKSKIQQGQQLHLVLANAETFTAAYICEDRPESDSGIWVEIKNRGMRLAWSDIVEFWPIPNR